ncbi:MAG: CDP-glycerol glycerophosphotransferase family protein, partial [Clostridia bacterium]|nr:CDP-glycerol glycerophosphotransferase family protein [Clostridia bacterium]
VLIGVLGAGIYSARTFIMKLRQKLSGGKVKVNDEKIPIVIFSDHKRYWSVFDPICRELDRRGVDVVYLTGSEDDPAIDCPYEHVKGKFLGSGNKMYAGLNFIKASVFLSTTPGLDVYQWKRSKEVDYYVHIPHAASEICLYRMFGIDYYDAVLISGEYQAEDIRNLEKLRSLPEKELYKIGIPYMDEMAARLEREGPAPEHPRTVLLAPSWGPSALFSVYGSRIIDVLLKTGYRVIIRPHPQSFTSEKDMMDKLMKQYPESDMLEWNRDTDNFDVLRRSDILISDFSGVIFDFTLVYDKPVIYTDPDFDLSPYDAWWLKTPLWTTGALPRIGQRLTDDNMESLKEIIDECLSDPRFARGRAEVKAETWEHFSCGTQRTVDYLVSKLDELTKEGEAK